MNVAGEQFTHSCLIFKRFLVQISAQRLILLVFWGYPQSLKATAGQHFKWGHKHFLPCLPLHESVIILCQLSCTALLNKPPEKTNIGISDYLTHLKYLTRILQSNVLSPLLMTPWSTVPLEKLLVPQLVQKFTTFYQNWRFIIMFTLAHHMVPGAISI